MALCPSSVPQRVALSSPLASSLSNVPDPEFDLARAASSTVTGFLATLVTDPSFESTAACVLVTELVDFPATCRLDYFTSPVIESESDCPPSDGGELAFGSDVIKDRQFELRLRGDCDKTLQGARNVVVIGYHHHFTWHGINFYE
ncbi:unnamed protein product [Closterium sp. NIES-54]